MLCMSKIVLASTLVSIAAGSNCPELAALRTVHVSSLSSEQIAHALDGFWYEHGYIDPAQVGARCQTLNATIRGPSWTTGRVDMDFSVKYGSVPFTITESYAPNAELSGVFLKRETTFPGGKLLQLPTVVVDVSPTSYILFSCLQLPLVPPVHEIVVASREVSAA